MREFWEQQLAASGFVRQQRASFDRIIRWFLTDCRHANPPIQPNRMAGNDFFRRMVPLRF